MSTRIAMTRCRPGLCPTNARAKCFNMMPSFRSLAGFLMVAGGPVLPMLATEEASPPAANKSISEARESGPSHLAQLTAQPWAGDWKGATLENVRLVEQKPNVSFSTGLPPAWHAKIAGPNGAAGYLLWDSRDGGKLIEFALDAKLKIDSPDAKALAGVPPLQQFAIPDGDGGAIASGCVPTSAASVLGFWIDRGQPQWRGDAGAEPLPALAKRLRARLTIKKIPDKDGFTETGMTLAGAMPRDLARAIQADADEHSVSMTSAIHPFKFDILKSEIDAGRPVMLSCVVRVPHKPELSWGHEIAGVGWAKINGGLFAGVLDNFYPTKNPETIRWIRTDAFSLIITVRPAADK